MPGKAKKIYVQIDIDCPLDRLWDLTQTPDLHQRWDLRFTQIRYLPRPDLSKAQQFLYATRIGLGMNIRGGGESIGNTNGPDGERTSALRFWSDDPKSLIHQGSGYWKYLPLGEDKRTVRFLTLYDYGVRFNAVGRLFDRLVFRQIIGWATAWSFDRLRLWIEKDIDPAVSMRHSLAYLTARLTLGLIWIYQGAVPKLIFRHPGELDMLRAAGIPDSAASATCIAVGCGELALGLMLVFGWRFAAPLWLTLIAMPAALAVVAIKSPEFLAAPFNPVSLNLSVFTLAAIALLFRLDLPSADHCVRRPPRREE